MKIHDDSPQFYFIYNYLDVLRIIWSYGCLCFLDWSTTKSIFIFIPESFLDF